MDSGQTRQLPRFTTGTKTFSAQWDLTNAEFEDFKTFFHTALENGTLFFDLTIPTDEGFQTKSLRFVGGEYSESYVPHAHWRVSATLEEQIVQDVPATDDTPVPVWFQPVHNIYVNTTIDESYANSMLLFEPIAGNTIIITVPEIFSPNDYLPFGITNKGPGSVLVVVEGGDGGDVDPSETWESLSVVMGAWGVYRCDTGVTLDAYDRVSQIADLSGNLNHLAEDSSTDVNTTSQPGTTWIYRSKIVSGELVTEKPDAYSLGQPTRLMGTAFRGKNVALSFTEFHIIAVVEFPLPLLTGFFIRLTDSSTTPNELGVKITASPTTKWFQQCGTYQNSNSDYHYPTSGTAKRIVEVVKHASGQFLFIDGVNAGHALPVATAMDIMGFGSKKNQPSAEHAVVKVSAFIIFDNTDHLENYTGRSRLERVRNYLATEFP
jgi:hypothetical protein